MGQGTSWDQGHLFEQPVQQDETIVQKQSPAAITDTNGTWSIDGAAATDTAAKSTDTADGANQGAGLST